MNRNETSVFVNDSRLSKAPTTFGEIQRKIIQIESRLSFNRIFI